MDAPFQILECNPYGFVEIIRVLPLDRGLQCLTYTETVFGKLDKIFVANHLILVGSSMKVHKWV